MAEPVGPGVDTLMESYHNPVAGGTTVPAVAGSTTPPPGSDEICTICLGRFQNLSILDTCFHRFCFTCITEWARVNAVCPLCKQAFKSLMYDIKSLYDYKIHRITVPVRPQPQEMMDMSRPSLASVQMGLRYRTTRLLAGGSLQTIISEYAARRNSSSTGSGVIMHNSNTGGIISTQASTSTTTSTTSFANPYYVRRQQQLQAASSGGSGGGLQSVHNGFTWQGNTGGRGGSSWDSTVNSSRVASWDRNNSRVTTFMETLRRVSSANPTVSTSTTTPSVSIGSGSGNARSAFNIIGGNGSAFARVSRMMKPNQPIKPEIVKQRRRVYIHALVVLHCNTDRETDVSPRFFRENPACTHRLYPWLQRELSILFEFYSGTMKSQEVDFVANLVMSMLPTVEIESSQFSVAVRKWLKYDTIQFQNEFKSFARSPYTMEEYDRNVVYHDPDSRLSSRDYIFTPPPPVTAAGGGGERPTWDSPDINVSAIRLSGDNRVSERPSFGWDSPEGSVIWGRRSPGLTLRGRDGDNVCSSPEITVDDSPLPQGVITATLTPSTFTMNNTRACVTGVRGGEGEQSVVLVSSDDNLIIDDIDVNTLENPKPGPSGLCQIKNINSAPATAAVPVDKRNSQYKHPQPVRRADSDCSLTSSSDSEELTDDSIELVKIIKPQNERTPELIVLSSDDEKAAAAAAALSAGRGRNDINYQTVSPLLSQLCSTETADGKIDVCGPYVPSSNPLSPKHPQDGGGKRKKKSNKHKSKRQRREPSVSSVSDSERNGRAYSLPSSYLSNPESQSEDAQPCNFELYLRLEGQGHKSRSRSLSRKRRSNREMERLDQQHSVELRSPSRKKKSKTRTSGLDRKKRSRSRSSRRSHSSYRTFVAPEWGDEGHLLDSITLAATAADDTMLRSSSIEQHTYQHGFTNSPPKAVLNSDECNDLDQLLQEPLTLKDFEVNTDTLAHTEYRQPDELSSGGSATDSYMEPQDDLDGVSFSQTEFSPVYTNTPYSAGDSFNSGAETDIASYVYDFNTAPSDFVLSKSVYSPPHSNESHLSTDSGGNGFKDTSASTEYGDVRQDGRVGASNLYLRQTAAEHAASVWKGSRKRVRDNFTLPNRTHSPSQPEEKRLRQDGPHNNREIQ